MPGGAALVFAALRTIAPTASSDIKIPLDSPISRFLLDPLGTLAGWASSLLDRAQTLAPTAGTAVLLVLLVLAGARLGLGRWRLARLQHDARVVEILSPPSVDPGGAEALWRNLHGLLRSRHLLLGRPHLAWEYRWTGERLGIGLWVPGVVSARLVARAVEAAWPGARTRIDHQSSPPLPTSSSLRGGVLRLAGPEWWGLRTDHDSDPLRALLGAAGERDAREAVVVQVLARPASTRQLARCRKVARALRRGQSPTALGRLLDLVGPGTRGTPSAYGHDPERPAQVREILAKAAGPGWEALIRYGVAAAGQDARRVVRRAHGVAAAFAVHADRNQLVRRRLTRPARTLQARSLRRGGLLSMAELAALAHLPWDLGVPGVTRAGAKAVAPAPAVPATGKVLGDSDAGGSRPVAVAPADGRHHLHVLGATGSGKSTLLAQLVLQDVHTGRGAVVIDPRGDLVRDLLDRLPARAIGRTVLLDSDEQAAPPSLNMLEGDDAELAVEHVVEVFRRVFVRAWGPRTDDILRSACLTLLRHGPATLADVPRLLSDAAFRERLTSGLDDPAGLSGFWSWYQDLTPAGQAQLVGPALSRLRAVLLRGFARDVLGQTASSFQLGEVLDGGLLLARLPKGTLGDDTSRLLGSFVVAKTWQAALERARAGEHARVDATLYIDEAHNFLHLPYRYEEMLTEARGYRLGLVLAHQHLAQLPAELRDAAAANARTKVYFTVSPEDARHLEAHVAPELSAHDLSHLGAWQAAVRPLAGGQELPACTIRTRPLGPVVPGRAQAVREAARRRYGRSAAQRRRATLKRGIGPDQVRIRRASARPDQRSSS
jgi:Type IV secretion-system coupling protein DNA-binding domain